MLGTVGNKDKTVVGGVDKKIDNRKKYWRKYREKFSELKKFCDLWFVNCDLWFVIYVIYVICDL